MKRMTWPKAIAAWMLLTAAASCVQELQKPDPYQSGEKISVSLSVGLENTVQTRADDAPPRISDGTRATTLIYALYKCVETPDGQKDYELLMRERKDGVAYPYKITGLELVRGLDYKLVFWAQSPEGDRYYDTGELKNIVVKYDDPWQQNNDEARDAFCKSFDFNDEILKAHDYRITLRRALAQINVGIAPSEWETLQNNGIDIARSAINIIGVARKFDLVHNCILAPDDVTDDNDNGDTQGYTTANYGQSQIPHLQEAFGKPSLEIKRNDGSGENEQFIWVSMSYILAGAPAEDDGSAQSATVDVTSLVFSYGENGEKELQPSGFPMNAVPVRANYRTNILFEHGLTGTARVTLELNHGYDNDYVSEDGGNTWNGEIAEGVRIKSYRGSDEKKSHYGSNFFWVDFYVSNGKGLQWIADRSNGVPFSVKDIPTWTGKDGQTVTYKRFRGDDGEPDVEKYKQAIFDILYGHGLVDGGASSFDRLYREDKDGNLIPWTFDDSSIILVADIDFARDEATTGQYWAPIASKLAHMSDRNNTAPNFGYGFKGEFDGNGHTISHLRINNAEYNAGRPFYDETKGENTGEPLSWEDASHNAGLIAVASDYATVKNLRLYDAEIIGEWNVGGLVGFYCRRSNDSSIGLKIDNCQIENSRIAAIVSENNHDDDANCGGLVGSVSSRFLISNSSVINATLYSDFVIGGLIGVSVTYETSGLEECKLKNSTLILNEYNAIGNGDSAYDRDQHGFKRYVQRSTDFSAPYYYAYTFGNQYSRTSASGTGLTECSNITLNIFYDYSKVNSAYLPADADLRGHSTVQNMPLNIFPLLDGRYGRSVTIGSHITGTPSYMTGDTAYGLYIDISENPDWKWAVEQGLYTDGFTLAGGETGDNRLYSLNIQPGTGVSATAGLGITGDKGTATVRDLILNGEPAIKTGILLDKAKTVVLDNIAVYDVQYALADRAVPAGATLTVSNSDLRGITQYGSGYGSVEFNSTAFYPGSGTDENSQTGLCKPGSDTTFKGCVFREGFQFEIPAGVTVTFSDCKCGPASDPVPLTAENIGDYLRSNQGTCIIDGQTVTAD